MCAITPRLVTVMVLCMHLLCISSNQLDLSDEKRSGAKYCGRYLADVIHLVCGGKFNVLIQKKSRGDLMPADFMQSDADGEDAYWLQDPELGGLKFPFRPKYVARALVPGSFRRLVRGAHDECCRKSCTYQEIRTYCAPDAATPSPQWGE